jgi:ribosomal protein L37AE/L43A
MRALNWILKWILAVMLALSAGLLVIIFLSSRPELTPFLLRLILLVVVGLTGGLTARLFFRGIPVLFVILLSIISSLIAVLTIDHFYATAYQLIFLASDFRFKVPAASDISQLLLMTLVSLLPILIFRRGSKAVANQHRISKPNKSQASFSQTIKPVLVKADPRNWIMWKKDAIKPVKRDAGHATKIEKPSVSVMRTSASISPRQPLTVRTGAVNKPAKKKLRLPGNLFKGSQSDVKLVGEEEHVCPYCLEEVVKDDSRGVTVCHECGTWHHQDCWNLTGSCGVAHRNEL